MLDIQIIRETYIEKQKVVLIRISNATGAYIEFTNYGASITSAMMPNSKGKLANVVLGYNNLEDYFTDSFYLGATIGRYANRISGAKFMLNDEVYHLDKNDGENTNHGGFNGFNSQVFSYRIHESGISFTLDNADGSGGFSGDLHLEVNYQLHPTINKLSIEYKSISNKATPVNFTNHSYFNLADTKDTVWKHQLCINSDSHLEMNDKFLPTGKILNVRDSAFDFTTPTAIGNNCKLKKDNLVGYNAYYIKDRETNGAIATLCDPLSKRALDVYSTMPGVQIYTGDFLSGMFAPYGGVCLEAQYHPDGVNHQHFDSCILVPNQERKDRIEFHFYCID